MIGSVSASEFMVAVAASLGFLFGLGRESVGNLLVVAGLAIGGAIAAPAAAWLVSRVPATLLGTAVGGIIVITNAQKLFKSFEVTGTVAMLLYLLIAAGWIALLSVSWRRSRLTRAESAGSLEKLQTPVAPVLREEV